MFLLGRVRHTMKKVQVPTGKISRGKGLLRIVIYVKID